VNNPPGLFVPPGDANGYFTLRSVESVKESDLPFIQNDDFGAVAYVYFEYFDTSGNRYCAETCRFRLKNGAIANCREQKSYQCNID